MKLLGLQKTDSNYIHVFCCYFLFFKCELMFILVFHNRIIMYTDSSVVYD
uniref:Macaca fascicularis brain cDNA, clone: QflA-17064 n=1 Tax=Macaca fascicularis TaxID=9541 RepID=I7GI47_MACFA|nr:unnamed protein product [Macaca fascicularis]